MPQADFTKESEGVRRVYSRRFYGGDRYQRSRPAPMPAITPEKSSPTEYKSSIPSEPIPKMALDIPVTESVEEPIREYTDPRDFLPVRDRSEFYDTESKFPTRSSAVSKENGSENDALREVSVYPDVKVEQGKEGAPDDTPSDTESPKTEDDTGENAENTEVFSLSLRNMTLEDMMLAGLLMMGSSGEYDDEIMLILGLILMIGA